MTGTQQESVTYLGDGAYARSSGFDVAVFTSNGVDQSEPVYLDASAIRALVLFAARTNVIDLDDLN